MRQEVTSRHIMASNCQMLIYNLAYNVLPLLRTHVTQGKRRLFKRIIIHVFRVSNAHHKENEKLDVEINENFSRTSI